MIVFSFLLVILAAILGFTGHDGLAFFSLVMGILVWIFSREKVRR